MGLLTHTGKAMWAVVRVAPKSGMEETTQVGKQKEKKSTLKGLKTLLDPW